MTSPGCKDGFLEIGVVGKPHGVLGRVRIHLYNAESDALFYLKKILLETSDKTTDYSIEEISPGPKGPSVLFEGMTNRDQAEQLRGAKILVNRNDLQDLEPQEFYVADLIGLEVLDGNKSLGRITASREQGGVEIATISCEDKNQISLPIVEDFVVEVDFEAKRVIARDTDLLPRSKNKNAHRGSNE